jgi:hypothetical protein
MKQLEVEIMSQMLIIMSEQEEFNEIESFDIKRSDERLKKLLFKVIERSRLEKIFNYKCEGSKIND